MAYAERDYLADSEWLLKWRRGIAAAAGAILPEDLDRS